MTTFQNTYKLAMGEHFSLDASTYQCLGPSLYGPEGSIKEGAQPQLGAQRKGAVRIYHPATWASSATVVCTDPRKT